MKVGLFVTCLVDLVRPNIGFAACKLLEDAGCEVIVPETQTCCGQPGYNSGARDIAKTLARKVLAEFKHCDYVVAPSGSCSGQMKLHVVEDLFKGEPEEAAFRQLAAKWYELSDFLVNVLKIERLSGKFDGSVTYHDSCAGLRELGIKIQPRKLLAQTGCDISEMQDAENAAVSAARSRSSSGRFPHAWPRTNVSISACRVRAPSWVAILVACSILKAVCAAMAI